MREFNQSIKILVSTVTGWVWHQLINYYEEVQPVNQNIDFEGRHDSEPLGDIICIITQATINYVILCILYVGKYDLLHAHDNYTSSKEDCCT